jgi:valyl-tRNA synthetase
LEKHSSSILSSVGAKELKRVKDAPSGMPAMVTGFGSVYIDLASGIDVEVEKARLSKELDQLKNIISSIEKKLGNAAFTEKAPAQVVEGARRQLADNLSKRQETEEALKALNL